MCAIWDEVKEEGKVEAKKQIIKNMIDEGFNLETIAKICSINVENIKLLM